MATVNLRTRLFCSDPSGIMPSLFFLRRLASTVYLDLLSVSDTVVKKVPRFIRQRPVRPVPRTLFRPSPELQGTRNGCAPPNKVPARSPHVSLPLGNPARSHHGANPSSQG